ncbi:hypothetical protein ACU61A_15740 [Pseudonocardia sichuanensis]
MAWPPELTYLKRDLGIEPEDTLDDDVLGDQLAAAVAFVERVRGSSFDFAGDPSSPLPAPTEDLILGTVRLAGRWHTRRRSPDGLVDMGELGSTRVAFGDIDIDRLLGIGRFRGSVIA